MARIATATKTTKPAPRGRKPTRRATPIAAKTGAKAKTPKAPGIAAVSKRASAAPAPEPKVSKEELRARLEKLERANAALRAKSREANRAAKTAAARIAELENQVAQLEKRGAGQTVPAPAKAGRNARRERGIDPGDAVPPGVAVEEPALLDALDAEAETALENLEHHLGGA
jgi:phage I-like protein